MTKEFFIVSKGQFSNPSDIIFFSNCEDKAKNAFKRSSANLKVRIYRCIEVARMNEEGTILKSGEIKL